MKIIESRLTPATRKMIDTLFEKEDIQSQKSNGKLTL
jgi:hypothetical protein